LKDNILNIIGSPARARILQMLSDRPRSLSELAGHLNLTPQAVLKHLKMLHRAGIIEVTPIEGSRPAGVKQMIRLARPIFIDLDSQAGLEWVEAYVSTDAQGVAYEGRRIELLKALNQLGVEEAALLRRIRLLRARVRRLVKELFELEYMKSFLRRGCGCSVIDEALILSQMMGEEVSKVAEALHMSEASTLDALHKTAKFMLHSS